MTPPLVPVQRTDRNGKTVTRWVRPIDGEETPALRIPAPSATRSREVLVGHIFETIFDGRDPHGDPIRVTGSSCYYSEAFARSALAALPVRTLKMLDDALGSLEPEEVRAKNHLLRVVYAHIAEMYDMGQTGAAKHFLEQGIRRINNALVFVPVADLLDRITGGSLSDSSYCYALDAPVKAYEDPDWEVRLVDVPETHTDYSRLPAAQQNAARDGVFTNMLVHAFSKPDSKHRFPDPDPEMVAVVAGNRHRWADLVEVVRERGVADAGVIRAVLDSNTTALSKGVL